MKYKVVGVMSGTSLDGIDIACCEFEKHGINWAFNIVHAETVEYEEEFIKRLKKIVYCSGIELVETDVQLGKIIGEHIFNILEKVNFKADFVASHGHTVFHQPERGITWQIGNGNTIRRYSQLPVINDFRLYDVSLGGQGAPLVPIGDKYLFSDYDFCLNLGGIANISFQSNNTIIAYDICPANMVLNHLAARIGKKYDHNGEIARKGSTEKHFLELLTNLDYYKKPIPKSLGYEYIEKEILLFLNENKAKTEDLLHTFSVHLASKIAEDIETAIPDLIVKENYKLLATGGGAFNKFVIEELQKSLPKNVEVIVPSEEIVKFKEALVFAFLGLLRSRNENNCLKSVTGATNDNMGGAIHGLLYD